MFSDYHSFENTATNYCGLMMKLIYRESPQLLNRLFEVLFGDREIVPVIGPIFRQQTKKSCSIPDLDITQTSFQILVETKKEDWFYDKQIWNHSTGFDAKVDLKILVLLTDEHKNSAARQSLRDEIYNKFRIFVLELTFEDLVIAFSEVCLSLQLREYLDDFREFLDRNTLLPRWKYRLDVVNCGATRHEVLDDLVYMCPDAGGQYNHQRAKYFGAYWGKSVDHVFVIDAVVSVDVNYSGTRVKWINTEKTENELIRRALDSVKAHRGQEITRNAIQVFLLDEKRNVVFKKDTKGGLFGSKRYFLIDGADNIDKCVTIIDNNCWSDFDL